MGECSTQLNVVAEITEHVATIYLHGTHGDLASRYALAYNLADTCRALRQNDDVWVVIITGRENIFCSGFDKELAIGASTFAQEINNLRLAMSVALIEKPVIAAINGDALDQALELALACDIRLASATVTLGISQVSRGIIPWDGGTQRLTRVVGKSRAMDMILTSKIITANEAESIGLVNEVVEPKRIMKRACQIAEQIASHGPVAVRYLKEAVISGIDMTLEQGMRLEADLNIILQSTKDRKEGIASFLERRSPKYVGQ